MIFEEADFKNKYFISFKPMKLTQNFNDSYLLSHNNQNKYKLFF